MSARAFTYRAPARRMAAVVVIVALVVGPAVANPVDSDPPAVGIAIARAITDPVAVTFDEPVRGVSPRSVVLMRSERHAVPAALECRSAQDAVVPCEAGGALRALLRPDAALIPGHPYVAVVNPPGAATVADLAGNLARRVYRRFHASISEQETSARAVYSWRSVRSPHAFGGSYQTERLPGATARYRFTGTTVIWYTSAGPDYGLADVYLDGAPAGRFDQSAPEVAHRVPRRFALLSPMEHTIEIVVVGARGALGRGTAVAVDAFEHGGPDQMRVTASPEVEFRWRRAQNDLASARALAITRSPGASVEFVFWGTGVEWHTIAGRRQGRVSIYVDGRRRAVFDAFARSTRTVRWHIDGLRARQHTVRLVALPALRARPGATGMAVDRFVVRLRPDIAAFRGLGAWVDLWDYYRLDPARATADMARRGVRTLYLQTSRYSHRRDIAEPRRASEWLEAAHDHGLKVIGWYVPAYRDVRRDVRRTVAIASFRSRSGDSFDGIAIDIEERRAVGFDMRRFNRGVHEHLRRVRRAVGWSVPVAAIVPAPMMMRRYPGRYPSFPWPSVGRYADVVAPMAYWSGRRADCRRNAGFCAYGYTRGNVILARRLTGLPVHVLGGIGSRVSGAEVGRFVRGARSARAFGASLYDYRATRRSAWRYLWRLR